ncbi:MAG: hypothetical protein V4538_13845 [Bacteroidota bacterium]
MGKYNFNGANINATNLHIGDNYTYNSAQDFIEKNTNLSLTETEKELVDIIFLNTDSNKERREILDSLKSIKSNNETAVPSQSWFNSFKPLVSKLQLLGNKAAIDITYKFLSNYSENLHLKEHLMSIFQ